MSRICKIFMLLLLITACFEEESNLEQLTISDYDNNKTVYNVEIADTPEKLAQGLMNRDSLPADQGMVFDLSQVQDEDTAMWMKNTKIPLDMLFIDHHGMIFWIYENAEPYSEKFILPPYKAHAVLEINGGEVKKNKIEIGYTVQYQSFKYLPHKPISEKDIFVEDIQN